MIGNFPARNVVPKPLQKPHPPLWVACSNIQTIAKAGEWGMGRFVNSLALGCDCLGEIVYLDAVMATETGGASTVAQAICLHEEDNAVLWKHVDHTLGAEVRRMRRMVVSCHATVANYEYLVYWRFYQDGNIECEVRATGIVLIGPVPDGGVGPYGALVDAGAFISDVDRKSVV